MLDEARFEASSWGAPSARLRVCLLGPPQVFVNGHKMVGLRGDKGIALLAYLAVEGRGPHRRGELAALLWPEQSWPQTLQNLRQTLGRLRRAIEDSSATPTHLLVDSETVQFNYRSDFWLDTKAFSELVAGVKRCKHHRLEACPACLSQLAQAVQHYRGEFVATLHPTGSQTLDEWLLFQREALQQQECDALYALARSYVIRGEMDEAYPYVRLLLRIDQWHEAGQRLLLRILAQQQGRHAAMRNYNAFRRTLSDELGIDPERATLDLAAQIRAGKLPFTQEMRP